MDHEDAVHAGATEKYLLGELTEDERERFEEHFFECRECAEDVIAAAAFMANARKALAEEPPDVRGAHRAGPRVPLARRLFWPMPAGVAAALGALALGLAHQTLVVVPRMRTELERAEAFQPAESYFLTVARSDTLELVARKDRRMVGIALRPPLDRSFPYYRCEVRDGKNRAYFATDAPDPADGREVELLVPLWRLPAGSYVIVLSGLESPSGPVVAADVARYPFTVRQLEE